MTEDKVLIVDDDRDFRDALSARIQSRGLGVDTASSGVEALEKVEKTAYCAILLDVVMPKMDGIETLRHLLKKNPDLQVILMTGHATLQEGVEAMKIGAMDFLEKPAEIEELVKKIEQAKANRMLLFEKRVEGRIEGILEAKWW